MRLAILNWRDLAHPDAGGAEVFIHEVGRRWAAQGHEVFVVSSRVPGLDTFDFDDGMRIVRVGRLKNGTHHLLGPRWIKKNFIPDAVLESINTIPYLLPLRRRGLPHFLPLVHQMAIDVWDAHLPSLLARPARRVERGLFRPYRDVPVAAVSESTKADLESVGMRSVTVIPQGGIGPQPLEEKESQPTFLFVGRLASNKRPNHAVEAFRLIKQGLPSARLWIVGEGPMRDSLQPQLPEGAELLGRLDRAELLKRMSRAHILLATSIREGWGLVVTEANAAGTPAIAYDVHGLRDSIKDGQTGILAKQDHQSLARAALQLLEDSQRYGRLREGAITWGQGFSWDRTAQVLLDHSRRTGGRLGEKVDDRA